MLTFNPHTHAKGQGQRSVGSKDRVERDGYTTVSSNSAGFRDYVQMECSQFHLFIRHNATGAYGLLVLGHQTGIQICSL